MIRVAIVGCGNLGRGAEAALRQNPDMELVAIFSRRDASCVCISTECAPVLPMEELDRLADQIDVLILCGGSATDLPEMTPALAAKFNVIDSFDNHSHIPEHIAAVEAAAKKAGTTAIVSCGWDPGLFSLMRIYGQAALPVGESYTFWGPGLSQGHSDAIRRIEGVRDARQYTIPVEESLEKVRRGENPVLTTRQKHTRQCFVVPWKDADLKRIEKEIKEMPGYFADYDTTVTFITQQELDENHAGMPHGGCVLRSGTTQLGDKHTVEFSLQLESNPQFTSSILVSCARAAYRMHQRGETGCFTMPEVRPCDLLPQSIEDIRTHLI